VRYWIAAVPMLVLTGCLKTAPVLKQSWTEPQPVVRYSAFENYPLPKRGPGPLKLPVDSLEGPPARSEPAAEKTFSEEFWNAVADLDLSGSRQAARGELEMRFADAVALLAAGDHEKATNAFEALGDQATDLVVATGAQMMLAMTLTYQHKWAAVRDLARTSRFDIGGRQTTASLERLGRVFADVDSQVTSMPEGRITLPMTLTAVGTPTVAVRINGKEYKFWLDTGASMTVLSSDVAAEAGVPIIAPETLSIGTFAGLAPARPALLKRLEIGSAIITNSPVIVIDSHLMRVRTSAEGVPWSGLYVDGIIGWDTIRQFAVALDYANKKISFQRPLNLETRGTSSQNLIWVGKPLVRVRTKAGVTLHFTLDTGAQTSFVNGEILKKAKVSANSSNARAYGLARTGGRPAQAVSALGLDVGGGFFVLKDLIVLDSPASGLINCDGILGSDIARFGTIRIDATNGLFSIEA
jgi:predicted aspartyl protease